MTDLDDLLLAFLVGAASCWAFWRLLFFVKPQVDIAPEVAFNPESGRLGIKVCNFGKRQAMQVEFRVAIMHRTAEGRLITRVEGDLQESALLALNPKRDIDVPWCIPTAFVFICRNGEEMLTDLRAATSSGQRRIVATLSVRDAVSGTADIRRRIYSEEHLVTGWYIRGLTFKIEPVTPARERRNAKE